MSYIGNQVKSVPFTVDIFSGDGGTSFGPMVRAPATVASIAVFVSGVYKIPGVDFNVSGTTLNFTVAPATATNNIVVHHLGNGVLATQVPVDGSVTGAKLTPDSVRGNNIVAGTITGNQLGQFSVSSNNFSSTANVAIVGRGIAAAIVFGG